MAAKTCGLPDRRAAISASRRLLCREHDWLKKYSGGEEVGREEITNERFFGLTFNGDENPLH